MNYAEIKQYDIANGPGVRVSLFVSGCTHHCKNCFNKEAWDFAYGNPFTEETEERIISYLDKPYVRGLTLLGGEPFERDNQTALLPFLCKVKKRLPDKDIWAFSGYDFEKDIMGYMYREWEATRELLSMIDVLVDGEFIEEQKSLALRFKGSANQRTILVQESLAAGKIVLYDLTVE
ncbi:MAG: anaerobic ribonucleoside-triphosphate reductase activating protein [Lachnospiraceae bacterium]|nr:anaerobic ribonucleoside-triphosphate reductase activating protein [Lachnospiraceae bacterium]